MRKASIVFAAAVIASAVLAADDRIKQHGRAIVEYRSDAVVAVASYEYAQRNHATPWLLIDVAIQATRDRIVVHRNELTLVGPDERVYPVATQKQFLADQDTLRKLLQNASIFQRPLEGYFSTRPTVHTISFFAFPGALVEDSAASNSEEVPQGELFFRSPDGAWKEGAYRLVLNDPKVKAELPINLQ